MNLLRILSGKPANPCKFVDISGRRCRRAVAYTCTSCGLEVCDGHALVDPLACAKDRSTKRYCEDCYYAL